MVNHQEGPEAQVNRSNDRINEAGNHDANLQVHIGKDENKQFTQTSRETLQTRDHKMNETINGGPVLTDGDKVIARPGQQQSTTAEQATVSKNELVTERNRSTADIRTLGTPEDAAAAKHHQETLTANAAAGLTRGDATFGSAALSASQEQSTSREQLGPTGQTSAEASQMQSMAAAAGVADRKYANTDDLNAAIERQKEQSNGPKRTGG